MIVNCYLLKHNSSLCIQNIEKFTGKYEEFVLIGFQLRAISLVFRFHSNQFVIYFSWKSLSHKS